MPIAGPTTNHDEIRTWAERQRIVPVEVMPHIVDHEPAGLELLFSKSVGTRPEVRVISWDDFFARFDLLGLAFVYDDESTGYNELLQRDEHSPQASRVYRRESWKH
jgi:hypothetical protein